MPGRPAPPDVRFWEKVLIGDGCWIWTSGTKGNGYGVFWDGVRQVCAHRYAYEWAYGPIPPDKEVDHICRVRGCVRYDHLRVLSHAENMKLGGPALATHCKRGHTFTDHRSPNGRRFCIECRRLREREEYRTGKRKGKGRAEDQYVTLPLWVFAELIR